VVTLVTGITMLLHLLKVIIQYIQIITLPYKVCITLYPRKFGKLPKTNAHKILIPTTNTS